MSLRAAWTSLVLFFHAPMDPLRLALFRIAIGMISLLNALLLMPDRQMWLADDGVLTAASRGLGLFTWFGTSALVVNLTMGLLIAASSTLIFGFASRASAAAVFLCLVSICNRNPYILGSYDTLLRLLTLFLMVSPCGAALSIDKIIAVARGKANANERQKIPALGIRLIQLQLCIVYLATAVHKSSGVAWQDGTAVHLVLQLTEFQRFPIPGLLHTELASKIMTWGTLFVEFAFPLFVWFKETRRAALIAALGLHLGLEYSMNIQLFQLVMIACLMTFVRDQEVGKLEMAFRTWLKKLRPTFA